LNIFGSLNYDFVNGFDQFKQSGKKFHKASTIYLIFKNKLCYFWFIGDHSFSALEIYQSKQNYRHHLNKDV